MHSSLPPSFAWPGWLHLRYTIFFSTLVTLWFGLIYTSADWLVGHMIERRVRIHFESELLIPLVPSFSLIYISIYGIYFFAPFVLRTRNEIKRLAYTQMLTIFIGGICFLLIPAPLAYPVPESAALGIWEWLFRLNDQVNLDYNLAPSLHVALSVTCIEIFAEKLKPVETTLFRIWGWAIAASVLLTHQHHVIDVITGFLLALMTVKITKTIS